MKHSVLATFLLACAFSGSAHAVKSVACFNLIQAAIEKDDAYLASATERLDKVLDQTTVPDQSVQFLEASILSESASNISLRLQLLWSLSALVLAHENDRAKFDRTLDSLGIVSQSSFKIFAHRAKLADLQLTHISDRQIRQAAMDVVLGMKMLAREYSPCIEQ